MLPSSTRKSSVEANATCLYNYSRDMPDAAVNSVFKTDERVDRGLPKNM